MITSLSVLPLVCFNGNILTASYYSSLFEVELGKDDKPCVCGRIHWKNWEITTHKAQCLSSLPHCLYWTLFDTCFLFLLRRWVWRVTTSELALGPRESEVSVCHCLFQCPVCLSNAYSIYMFVRRSSVSTHINRKRNSCQLYVFIIVSRVYSGLLWLTMTSRSKVRPSVSLSPL